MQYKKKSNTHNDLRNSLSFWKVDGSLEEMQNYTMSHLFIVVSHDARLLLSCISPELQM